uniref:Uncharacterized protein n=1 Tax=Arundo donax TaxID=35708 RepID=A0A0A9FKY7_ARUDO
MTHDLGPEDFFEDPFFCFLGVFSGTFSASAAFFLSFLSLFFKACIWALSTVAYEAWNLKYSFRESWRRRKVKIQ